jgi:hypothetical protein
MGNGLGDPSPSLWHSDIWNAGQLGSAYEPIAETDVAGRLQLPPGVHVARAQDRDLLRRQFDRLRQDLDIGQSMERLDRYERQALDLVLSSKAQAAFCLEQEPERVRDTYARTSFGEKALLARRLVEAGVTFVVVSGMFGVFDNHGDDVVWGGLLKGLKPLFPGVDQSLSALIMDLADRGLLENTLVIAMGEFCRSPVISNTSGRTHWTNCMSVLVAGGSAARGHVIGSADDKCVPTSGPSNGASSRQLLLSTRCSLSDGGPLMPACSYLDPPVPQIETMPRAESKINGQGRMDRIGSCYLAGKCPVQSTGSIARASRSRCRVMGHDSGR